MTNFACFRENTSEEYTVQFTDSFYKGLEVRLQI